MSSDNVIRIGCRLNGETDPMLGSELAASRRFCGVTYDSNEVIIRPMHSGYMPLVGANGNMQLGEQGDKAFHDTFGEIEDLNIRTMEVVYEGIRHALARRVVEDTNFHDKLGELAVTLGKKDKIFRREERHDAEIEIMGRMAAYVAKRRAATKAPNNARRERLPAIVATYANPSSRRVSQMPDDPHYRNAMRFFSETATAWLRDNTIPRLLSSR